MFWIGFISGLLTPVAGYLLWLFYSWLTDRNLKLTCKCNKVFGVLASEVRWGIVKDKGEPYKRPTLTRVTNWKHRWHRWFHCPLRKKTIPAPTKEPR